MAKNFLEILVKPTKEKSMRSTPTPTSTATPGKLLKLPLDGSSHP